MISKPRLLLRVDVSREHGTGHLMRCKALADAWNRSGGESEFATTSDFAPYAGWLGGAATHPLSSSIGSVADAEETVALAKSRQASWVAADGYHFDAAWQEPFADRQRLLLFDDYGHGAPHRADLILNQNPSANAALYDARDSRTRLLLGPKFALLRQQFESWRGWKRETPARAQRLLVTFGGTDPAGMTCKAIEALRGSDLTVELVVGAGNARGAEIEARCAGTNLHVRRNVTDMPALIAECDFALCAAGTTTLECAFLQQPQILVTVADNQLALADALVASGAAELIGWHTQVTAAQIFEAVAKLRDDAARRAEMSAAAGRLVDGHGAARVVTQMRAREITLRPAQAEDARRVWDWANDSATRAASFNSEPIPWPDHEKWFNARLTDPATKLWLASTENVDRAGCVRFAEEADTATISVSVAPECRGAGLGAAMILRGSHALFRESSVQRIDAFIRPENGASLAAFARAGYVRSAPTEVRGCAAEHWFLRRDEIPDHELI